jgi:hypothetical protein
MEKALLRLMSGAGTGTDKTFLRAQCRRHIFLDNSVPETAFLLGLNRGVNIPRKINDM